MRLLKVEKMNDARYLFTEAPIASGLAGIGIGILSIGLGITLVFWGVFLGVLRLISWPFRNK
jgi:hypothetical protein